MDRRACVDFVTSGIGVNDKWYEFDSLSISTIEDVLPENVKDYPSGTINYINWRPNEPNQTCFSFINGSVIRFDLTEENYNKYIQPYVDLWQAEKDRLDAEQAAREAEYNSFEATQARALSKLNTDFEKAKEEAYVTSSLGFKADANSTANENVNGLLVTVGEGTVSFCDYNNEFHDLNKSQLETLRSEIISNAQNLYTQKWTYRTAIEQCETNEQIKETLAQVKFIYEDFSA